LYSAGWLSLDIFNLSQNPALLLKSWRLAKKVDTLENTSRFFFSPPPPRLHIGFLPLLF
jgi:hypothetical protein